MDADGSNLQQLTDVDGYDAEATLSPTGDRMIFTSTRDGDLELYTMALDGSDVRRITHRLGYDGGAFFSPDGSRIVWRAQYPETPEEQADAYRRALELAACQETVEGILFFHVRDEPDLAGWQSGVRTADGAPKASLEPFRAAAAAARAGDLDVRCEP